MEYTLMEGKSHMIVSIDAEKTFDEILTPFMIKNSTLGMERNFVNMTNGFI